MVLAGSIDADAADKAAHFIMVADSFHLPLVFLADNPGVLPGHGVGACGHPAQRRPHVRGPDPGHHAEGAPPDAQGVRVRLDGDGDDRRSTSSRPRSPIPGATLGAMGAGAMSRATGADADETAELREAELQRVVPLGRRPSAFDELIDPRETRDALLDALQRAARAAKRPRNR